MTTAEPMSFAEYLCARLVLQKGFVEGAPPEAAPLAAQCHHTLTWTDGFGLVLVAVIDHTRPDPRSFTLSAEALLEVGTACLGYTGTMQGVKMPVGIQLWEVGVSAGPERRTKYAAVARTPGTERVDVSAWVLDPDAANPDARLWTTVPWYRASHPGRRWLQRALTEPRKSLEALADDAATVPGDPSVTRPVLTYALLGVIAAVFAGEMYAAGAATPTVSTLVSVGGLVRARVVEDGQWWRFGTAPLLHGNWLHLLMNAVSLWMVGNVLEPLVGRAWFAALFVLGALGGSLLGLVLNPAHVVSVGASGAIMALFAAALTVSWKLPEGTMRGELQGGLLRVLVPSLLPIAAVRTGDRIDYAAHFGGALMGVALGLGLMALWPRRSPVPRAQGVARAVGVLGLCVALWGVSQGVRGAASAAVLIPPNELSPTARYSDLMARADELATRYPRDPRARFVRAMARVSRGETRAAEEDLRAGLADEALLRTQFPDRRLEVSLRASLAEMLQERGETAEARRVVAPVCDVRIAGQTPPQLILLGLCDTPPR